MARLSEVIGRYVAPPGAAPPAEDEIGEGDEEGEGLEEEEVVVEEVEQEELEVFYQGGAKVQEETLVAASVPPDATDAPLPPGDNLEAPPPDQPPRGFAVFINAPELLGMQQALFQRAWGCQVLDRFTVVLKIFRARAATREAHLRLELAELDFNAARLSDETVWQVGKGRDQQRAPPYLAYISPISRLYLAGGQGARPTARRWRGEHARRPGREGAARDIREI